MKMGRRSKLEPQNSPDVLCSWVGLGDTERWLLTFASSILLWPYSAHCGHTRKSKGHFSSTQDQTKHA